MGPTPCSRRAAPARLRWATAFGCACACLVLAAAAPAAAAGPNPADIERAAEVGPGGLVMYAPTTFATANGGRKNADFVPGVFAQSAQRILLLSYDRITKSFRQDMTFDLAASPAIALVSGPLGRKQLQIQTESGVVACELGGFFNGGQVATQVYDRLIAAGARRFESPGWVNPNFTPAPVIIPIYIPAGD